MAFIVVSRFRKGMKNANKDGMMGLKKNACTENVEAKSFVKINLDKPCVGLMFDEDEDVQTFYTKYPLLEGFGIIKRSSNLGMDEKLR